MKKLIFVVCYNAEKNICKVLNRIPAQLMENPDWDVLIIDDASTDDSYLRLQDYIADSRYSGFKLIRNNKNEGYGGNQKLGYRYALAHDYGLVVLLHGDGQYAPEYLLNMADPIENGEADVVLGSRMIRKRDALRGGMPFYKWFGNIILTKIQNCLLETNFSEFHTGYRSYRVSSLAKINFPEFSDYYDFDTEIILELLKINSRFAEISIPTFYGDEISYVNCFKYACLIIYKTWRKRVVLRY